MFLWLAVRSQAGVFGRVAKVSLSAVSLALASSFLGQVGVVHDMPKTMGVLESVPNALN